MDSLVEKECHRLLKERLLAGIARVEAGSEDFDPLHDVTVVATQLGIPLSIAGKIGLAVGREVRKELGL